MPTITRASSLPALHHQVAQWIIQHGEACLRQHDRFTLALSGGSTPLPIYALLATAPYRDALAWEKVHIFFVDERAVPPEHPDSNYFHIHQAWLQHTRAQVYRMEGELGAETGAMHYGRMLKAFFDGGAPLFDLVLLGMGTDGHTASLFPHTPPLNETHHRVMPNRAPVPPHERITLTAWAINSAKEIGVVVSGKEKANTVAQVLGEEMNPQQYPIQLIAPTSGSLRWFMDAEASSALP
ncbi:MAG: 6-phosphogluconolactonase [Phototrophicaceae bacterium]